MWIEDERRRELGSAFNNYGFEFTVDTRLHRRSQVSRTWCHQTPLTGSPCSSKPTATSVRDPPGYQPALAVSKTRNSSTALSKSTASQAELDSLRRQKAWELALAPAKNVPMQGARCLPCWTTTTTTLNLTTLIYLSNSVHDVHDGRRRPNL